MSSRVFIYNHLNHSGEWKFVSNFDVV